MAEPKNGYRLSWEEVRRDWPIWILLTGSVAAGLWAYPRLPERVPIHWDLQGRPNGWGSPFTAALGIPLLSIGIYLLMLVTPLIDPKRANYARFTGFYRGLRWGLVGVLTATYAAALAYGLGHPVDIGLFAALAVGLLWIYIGNSLGRVRYNYFVGIRTPWTLADETVWQRTHRVGGRLFVLTGLLTLMALPFSRAGAFWALTGGSLVTVIGTLVYSAVLYLLRPPGSGQ
ncbi:MAG: SdpI family protein [Limnochordaceae bacterium]|nr:SdpI family protein [Limnochordaceae bacterium]